MKTRLFLIFYMKRMGSFALSVFIFCMCINLLLLTEGLAQSTFAILQFGNSIQIEVPRSWTYLNDNIKNHLNTSSEAIVKLSGYQLNQGNNQILVAANAYTNSSKPSALLRLSIRPGENLTQADMKQLSKASKAEISEIMTPILSETKKAMLNVEGVKNVKPLDARIEQSKNLICLFVELETDTTDGIKLQQTYICPAGDKSIKLSTAYRKSEASIFKPVLQYVWNSLKAK